MKIKNSLPQFNKKRVLLIVTGKEHADFYLAYDGEIIHLEKIVAEREKRTDTHSKFWVRTSAYFVSGPNEAKADLNTIEFLRMFEEALPGILRKSEAEGIYLFSPVYIGRGIIKLFPKSKASLLISRFDGNYGDKHPFDLLEMIADNVKEDRVEPKSSEAQRLYDKFPQNEL